MVRLVVISKFVQPLAARWEVYRSSLVDTLAATPRGNAGLRSKESPKTNRVSLLYEEF